MSPRAVRLGLVLTALLTGCEPCRVHVESDLPSPDGQLRAVVYSRWCPLEGPRTTTEVSVLASTHPPEGPGLALTVADTNRTAVRGPGGGPLVLTRWLDRRELEVRYLPSASAIVRDTLIYMTDIRVRPGRDST